MRAAVDEGQAPNHRPVRVVADRRLPVGAGQLPLYVSQDWSNPLPGITRAVIVVHGRLRNADTYLHTAKRAASAAGPAGSSSLLVVPQFLAGVDVRQHDLAPETLRWSLAGWMGGGQAEAPAPISSFEALDALLARLGSRDVFPNMRTLVVAGHSGGAQVVQRYAVLGRAGDALSAAGITVRYVVANPSSYVYFSADRPTAGGGLAPFDAARCRGFNTWKYGLDQLPSYAAGTGAASLEAAYAGRQVTYLWGEHDTDPNQPALDRSDPAMAQGPDRLARGQAYFAYLRARHPDLVQTASVVPGVAHDGDAMFTSPAGLAALFDHDANV